MTDPFELAADLSQDFRNGKQKLVIDALAELPTLGAALVTLKIYELLTSDRKAQTLFCSLLHRRGLKELAK